MVFMVCSGSLSKWLCAAVMSLCAKAQELVLPLRRNAINEGSSVINGALIGKGNSSLRLIVKLFGLNPASAFIE